MLPKRVHLDLLPAHKAFFAQHGERVSAARGEYFADAVNDHPWVYFVESGLVKISFALPQQPERIIGFFIQDMLFAQSAQLYSDAQGAAEFCAVTDTVAWRISRDTYAQAREDHLPILKEYVKIIQHNQSYLVDRIVYQSEPNIEKKFLRWLLFMLKYYGADGPYARTVAIPLTQEAIASFIHVSRETINKTMRDLIDDGVISLQYKRVSLVDASALKERLEL